MPVSKTKHQTKTVRINEITEDVLYLKALVRTINRIKLIKLYKKDLNGYILRVKYPAVFAFETKYFLSISTSPKVYNSNMVRLNL